MLVQNSFLNNVKVFLWDFVLSIQFVDYCVKYGVETLEKIYPFGFETLEKYIPIGLILRATADLEAA